jgi:GNAT superfamily N-acetyltransferase
MSGLDIRLARPDDRLKLIELQRRASLAAETGETLQKLLEQPELFDIDDELIAGNQVFVAHRQGHIVGFATVIADEGNDAELEGLFVEPTEWRRGVGRALVQQIEREAINWGATRLRVLANQKAVPFYEAVGFSAIGEQVTPLGPLASVMVRAVR